MDLITQDSLISKREQARNVAKGKKTLQQAIESGKLSAQDIAYIKVATDPWHDTSVENFNGIPDDYSGKSITEVITATYELKTPFVGSGNFNARIMTFPFLGSEATIRTANFGTAGYQEVSAPSPKNNVNIATATIDYSLAAAFDDYPVYADQLTLPQEVLVGNVKVAGLGVELVNTTAELTKQGLLSVARVPQPLSANTVNMKLYGRGGTANYYANPDLIPVISAPTTPSELTTYPDYDQWEAREGMYAVVRQYDAQSSSPMGWRGVVRCLDDEPVGNASSPYVQTVVDTSLLDWIPAATTGLPEAAYVLTGGVIPAPSDSVCVMLTGLSESSTLTLKLKWYLERRVNTSIPALRPLVPFVRDSPPINPLAIELVSRLWADLPMAVMFKENPAGEWWDKVLSTIGDVGPSILGMIPHPLAQAAARALPTVTKMMKSGPSESEGDEIKRMQEEIRRLTRMLAEQSSASRSVNAVPKTAVKTNGKLSKKK